MDNKSISRFQLKRSISVNSIQTGVENANSRMQFSQLLRLPSFSNVYKNKNDRLENNKVGNESNMHRSEMNKLIEATSSCSRKTELKNQIDHIANEVKRSPRRVSSYLDEPKELEVPNVNEWKRSPRRRSSYCDEYSKRENDRQGAREAAAILVRAQKVKKEFSERNAPTYVTSPGKRSKATLSRKKSTAGISPTKTDRKSPTPESILTPSTTTKFCPDSSFSKIRLHTTLTSLPSLPQQITKRDQRVTQSQCF